MLISVEEFFVSGAECADEAQSLKEVTTMFDFGVVEFRYVSSLQ